MKKIGLFLFDICFALQMVAHSIFLVTNPESPYYESEAFDKLLGFIQKHPRECTLREQNGKRSIVIKNVPTVEVACNYLDEIGKVQIQK